jgi:hypothetical protein
MTACRFNHFPFLKYLERNEKCNFCGRNVDTKEIFYYEEPEFISTVGI